MKSIFNLQAVIVLTVTLTLLFQFDLYKANQKNNLDLQRQITNLQVLLTASNIENKNLQQRLEQVE